MTDKTMELATYKRCTELAQRLERKLTFFDEVARGQPGENDILLQGAAWALRELLELVGHLGRLQAGDTKLEGQLQRLADRAEDVFLRLEPPP